MLPRYDCTRQEMVRKSLLEMPKTYSKTEQAVWVADSLMRWYDEHDGEGWANTTANEVMTEAVGIIGNGHWPEHRRGK